MIIFKNSILYIKLEVIISYNYFKYIFIKEKRHYKKLTCIHSFIMQVKNLFVKTNKVENFQLEKPD